MRFDFNLTLLFHFGKQINYAVSSGLQLIFILLINFLYWNSLFQCRWKNWFPLLIDLDVYLWKALLFKLIELVFHHLPRFSWTLISLFQRVDFKNELFKLQMIWRFLITLSFDRNGPYVSSWTFPFEILMLDSVFTSVRIAPVKREETHL